MQEEEEEFSVIVADFVWKPNPETISWSDPEFSKKITQRTKGITEEKFGDAVESWANAINSLPDFNEITIRKEISYWDIGIPGKDDFNIESYAAAYALQVSYRTRITEIISVVFAHFEMISQAQKSLKEMALNLSNGTAKDKEAIAAFTVHPFSVPLSNAKRLLTYLEAVLKNIDFASSQMDRISREHQALSRINQTYNSIGMSSLYEDHKPNIQKYNKSEIEIPSRRRIQDS